MRNIFLISTLLIVIIAESCTTKNESSEPVKSAVRPAFKWTTVREEQPVFSIILPGELKPYEQVNIYPKVKGFVRRIYVDRGSQVKKGQLLAVLEAPEIGQQHAARNFSSNTALQRFVFSKQSYQRLKEASLKEGAVATIELEKAYAQYLGDSAAYHSSRLEASASGQLESYLRITAPFAGVITDRLISEGALVGENGMQGTPMFVLTQESRLRLEVAIPEKQSQALSPGAKASFQLIDYPGEKFSATLSRNSRALNQQNKSVMAEFDIDNTNSKLRSGQFAKVSVQLQRKQPGLWVPNSSVVQAQSGIFVLKNNQGSILRIPVQLGIAKDSLVEVFGNLSAGDRILLKGSEEVKEGMKIE